MKTCSCTGLCCEAFPVSVPYPELISNPKGFTDGEKILDMLVFLGRMRYHPKSGIEYENEVDLFTCVHFNVETRRCEIYEDRPEMCKLYPTSGRCDHAGRGCDWQEVNGELDDE